MTWLSGIMLDKIEVSIGVLLRLLKYEFLFKDGPGWCHSLLGRIGLVLHTRNTTACQIISQTSQFLLFMRTDFQAMFLQAPEVYSSLGRLHPCTVRHLP